MATEPRTIPAAVRGIGRSTGMDYASGILGMAAGRHGV